MVLYCLKKKKKKKATHRLHMKNSKKQSQSLQREWEWETEINDQNFSFPPNTFLNCSDYFSFGLYFYSFSKVVTKIYHLHIGFLN